MTIDPRIGMYISIATFILSGLLGASATFTDLFGADVAKNILGWITIINIVVSGLNGFLHAIPSRPGAAEEFPLGPAKAQKDK